MIKNKHLLKLSKEDLLKIINKLNKNIINYDTTVAKLLGIMRNEGCSKSILIHNANDNYQEWANIHNFINKACIFINSSPNFVIFPKQKGD